MYLPRPFRVDDVSDIRRLLDRQPVAQLVTSHAGKPAISVLPVLVQEHPTGGFVVRGHLAKANPQAGHDGAAAAFSWLISSAYVSPSMYETKRQGDPKVVPTWNYEAVEAHGTLRVSSDPDEVLEVVTLLTDHHEADRDEPWRVDDAPAAFIRRMLAAIVAVEIEVTGFDAKAKLSQNRPEADRLGVSDALSAAGAAERAVAAAMQWGAQET